jgi:hypothetical protein
MIRPATGKLLQNKKKNKPLLDEDEITPQSDIGKRAEEQNRREMEKLKKQDQKIQKKKAGGSLSVFTDKPAWMRNR